MTYLPFAVPSWDLQPENSHPIKETADSLHIQYYPATAEISSTKGIRCISLNEAGYIIPLHHRESNQVVNELSPVVDVVVNKLQRGDNDGKRENRISG